MIRKCTQTRCPQYTNSNIKQGPKLAIVRFCSVRGLEVQQNYASNYCETPMFGDCLYLKKSQIEIIVQSSPK